MDFTPDIIWNILYIEILVVHLASIFRALEIWQKSYELHSFDCKMVQIDRYMIMKRILLPIHDTRPLVCILWLKGHEFWNWIVIIW